MKQNSKISNSLKASQTTRLNSSLSRPLSSSIQYKKSENITTNRSNTNSSKISRSKSVNKDKKINKIENLLSSTEENISRYQLFENIIKEIKSNIFKKIEEEIDEKKKLKNVLLNNIEIYKNRIKVILNQDKSTFKNMYNQINHSTKLENIQNRINHEKFINFGLNECKTELAYLKNSYEEVIEETRQIRNVIMNEDKEFECIKEEIQKLNGVLSLYKKEKENLKNGVAQLKSHIRLVKDKIKVIDDKNKELLLKFYSLSLK